MSTQRATKPSPASVDRATRSCFTVVANRQSFGFPVEEAQTIFRVGDLTPVPLGPDFVLALTNLRGRVMTVVSLGALLGQPGVVARSGALAIGLQIGEEDIALIVDEVGEVIEVNTASRLVVPPHIPPHHSRMLEGLYKVGDSILSVLHVPSLLPAQAERATALST